MSTDTIVLWVSSTSRLKERGAVDMLITINRVSAEMGISSRSLRYWEAAGLFKSVRDQSGWRTYDEYTLQCIRVTDLLRRLDIPISDIRKVIEGKTIGTLCLVLKKQMSRLDKTHSELDTLRKSISDLLTKLDTESVLSLLTLENTLLPVVLERKKHIISKPQGGISMKNVKSKYDEVRIVRLAPARVAAFSCVSTEPEDAAYSKLKDWIDQNKLQGTARMFGFNTEPYPTADNPAYGFGFCATVPEGVEIPEPLYEMRLPGGIYAVISDYEGDPSYGWKKVHELCGDSEWEWIYDKDRNPGLEEHIELAGGGFIIPILFPVRKR